MAKSSPIGTTRSRKRDAQIESGAYDGRYRTRIIRDKRKESSRTRCRGNTRFEFC